MEEIPKLGISFRWVGKKIWDEKWDKEKIDRGWEKIHTVPCFCSSQMLEYESRQDRKSKLKTRPREDGVLQVTWNLPSMTQVGARTRLVARGLKLWGKPTFYFQIWALETQHRHKPQKDLKIKGSLPSNNKPLLFFLLGYEPVTRLHSTYPDTWEKCLGHLGYS